MDAHGKLTITIQCTKDTICVEFHDTGPGFPPESTPDLFKPFFTTKERGKGTGLGLAICRDIVEKYEGKVTAENAPQGGGILKVHLPITVALSGADEKGKQL